MKENATNQTIIPKKQEAHQTPDDLADKISAVLTDPRLPAHIYQALSASLDEIPHKKIPREKLVPYMDSPEYISELLHNYKQGETKE